VQFDDGNSPNGVKTLDFDLHVADIPNYFKSADATTWTEDQGGQIFNAQTNEEGDGVTYTLVDGPEVVPGWININSTNGEIAATIPTAPDNSHVGSYTFTIRADGGHGDVVTQQFTLTVVNTPPAIDTTTPNPNGYLPNEFQVQEDSGGDTFQVELMLAEPGAIYSLIGAPSFGGVPVSIDGSGLITISGADNSEVGLYVFDIQVDDDNGGVVTQPFLLNITNRDPVWTDLPDDDANPGNGYVWEVAEDTTGNFDVGTDDEPAPVAATNYSVSGPSWVSIDSDTGELTAKPNNSHVGDTVVTVQFDDGNGGVITQDITIQVANDPPLITSPDETTWIEDAGAQVFDIQGADEDQLATYSLSNAPSWVNINTTSGTLWGVPENQQVGDWTFQIEMRDGNGGIDTQDFTLHVTNVAPDFNTEDHTYFNGAGGIQTFDVHTTDENSDHADNVAPDPLPNPNNDNLYSLSDYVNDPDYLGYVISDHVSIDPDSGRITWDGVSPFNDPSDPNEHAEFTFDITFYDGTVWITQPFDLHLIEDPADNPDNPDPNFFSDDETRFLEDEGDQVFDVEYLNEGAGVTYSLDGTEPPGLYIDSDDGEIHWDPTNKDVTAPVFGINPDGYSFDIEVDDNGTTVTQTFSLHVDNVDPWYTTLPRASWAEDSAGNVFDVGNTDERDGADPDGWAQYSFDQTYDTATYNSDADYWYRDGWLRMDKDTGELSMNPADLSVDDTTPMPTNYHVGSHSFKILVDDQHNNNAPVEQVFTLSIGNRINFTSADNDIWQEDTGDWTFDVGTDDEGYVVTNGGVPTTHDDVTYSLRADAPTWLRIDADDGEMWIDQDNNGNRDSPDNLLPGTYKFTIHADDGHPGSGDSYGDQTFTLTIPNRDPDFDPTVNNPADPLNPVGYDNIHMVEDAGLVANRVDFHTDDEAVGDTFYTLIGAPQWLTIDPYTGEMTGDPTNVETRDAVHGDTPYTFTVRCYDLNSLYAFGYDNPVQPDSLPVDGYTDQAVTLYVDNNPPVFTSNDHDGNTVLGDALVNEDAPWTFDVQTTDESVGGTQYYIDPADQALFPWITIDADTGLMTANPTNAHVGDHTFTIYVDDQHGGVVAQSFELTVTNVAPVWQTPPGAYTMTVTEDTTGNFFDLMADDELQHNPYAGTQVTYSLSGAPPGVSIDQYTGYMILDVTNEDVGITDITITVDDGNGGESSIVFTLDVRNTEPDFTTANKVIWVEDDPTFSPFDVDNTDEIHDHWQGPPDHDENLYTLTGAPSWLEIHDKDGVISITPGDTQNANGSPDNHLVGVYHFEVDFYDGDEWIHQPFTLTINNDPTDISHVDDQEIDEDTPLTGVTDSDIEARDEYDLPGYTQDYYRLWIRLDNQGDWIRVDGTGANRYNTVNDAWNGADISFDRTTGQIDWTPNNADIPDQEDPAYPGVYHHQFRVFHYDGHTSGWPPAERRDYFFVEINNIAPQWNADLPDWHLWEDTDDSDVGGDGTIDNSVGLYPDDVVQTDEEGQGLTYDLQIWDESTSVWVDWTDGYEPNGTAGGEIVFDEDTGEIEWETTNADVTVMDDGITPQRDPYRFQIRADDGNAGLPGESNFSDWEEFLVTVYNDPTDITPEAGQTALDPIGDRSIDEDDPFSIDFGSRDEQVEAGAQGDPHWQDSFYELWIDDDGSGPGVPVRIDPATGYQPNGALGGLIDFDKDSGEMDWTPNNLDVGDYTFTVIHNDGHGNTFQDDFEVTVNNTPPVFTALPVTWTLIEDQTGPVDYTLLASSIQTDDEGIGVTYSLEIDGSDVTQTDPTVFTPPTGITLPPAGGDWVYGEPNGPDGGVVAFNTATGEIQWATTNADVTLDTGGGPARPSYDFRIVANDGNGGIADPTFHVDVTNDPTNITVPGPQVIFEDGPALQLVDGDVTARDEQVESANLPGNAGPGDPGYTFYTLEIDRHDPLGNPTGFVDADWYNDNNNGGADIVFDSSTGAVTWSGATNRDVGDYEFRVTHYDGHNTSADATFDVTVNNVPVDFDAPSSLDGQTVVIPALKYFNHDFGSTDEGQHDWRMVAGQPQDRVTYSVSAVNSGTGAPSLPTLTIDQDTGAINWRAPAIMAGTHTVTVHVYDGNGGVDVQVFTLIVDDPVDDQTIEVRPETPRTEPEPGSESPGWVPEPEDEDESPNKTVSKDSPLSTKIRDYVEEVFKKQRERLDEILPLFDTRPLEQPDLEIGGTIAPIVGLPGFGPNVEAGKRLDFDADEVWLMERLNGQDLDQPSPDLGGSIAPDTPLNGFPPNVEAGKRLDFDYFPIKDTVQMNLDDLKTCDLLGL